MELNTAPPVLSKAPAPSAPVPAEMPSAPPAPTPSAHPAHAVQAVSPTPTASYAPTRPVPPAPPAQPTPTATSSTKTTVPSSPASAASHVPGPVASPAAEEATPAVVDSTAAPSPEEKRLTSEIGQLWTKHVAVQASFEKNNAEHTKAQGSFRKSREELKDIRDRLATLLHQVKPLVCRLGRGGGWLGFLGGQGIPRSTADRLVRAQDKAINSVGKSCATEQINSESNEVTIQRYARALWPKLSKTVDTSEALVMFITELRRLAEKSFGADVEAPDSASNDAAQSG